LSQQAMNSLVILGRSSMVSVYALSRRPKDNIVRLSQQVDGL
jgi:hypothetical protein